MTIFEYMGKGYYLGLKKIMDYVYYSNNHPTKESEITDLYENNDKEGKETNSNETFTTTSKTIREITSYGASQIDNIRYDFLKTLIQFVLEYRYETRQDDDDKVEPPAGFAISFNTLINEGFLKEIKLK